MLTPNHPNTVSKRSHRRNGFTLIEVMMAMFILALGMTAVASIFPVAALMQRRSYEDIVTRQLKDSVVAELSSKGILGPGSTLSGPKLDSGQSAYQKVKPLPQAMLSGGGEYTWPLGSRCYPAEINIGTEGNPPDNRPNQSEFEDPKFIERQFYWVPVVMNKRAIDPSNGQPTGPDNWQVFVFLLRKQRSEIYKRSNMSGANIGNIANDMDPEEVPKVVELTGVSGSIGGDQLSGVKAASGIYPGDMVLANNGQVLLIKKVSHSSGDPLSAPSTLTISGKINDNITSIWFGLPAGPGAPSVTARIFALGSEVIK